MGSSVFYLTLIFYVGILLYALYEFSKYYINRWDISDFYNDSLGLYLLNPFIPRDRGMNGFTGVFVERFLTSILIYGCILVLGSIFWPVFILGIGFFGILKYARYKNDQKLFED